MKAVECVEFGGGGPRFTFLIPKGYEILKISWEKQEDAMEAGNGLKMYALISTEIKEMEKLYLLIVDDFEKFPYEILKYYGSLNVCGRIQHVFIVKNFDIPHDFDDKKYKICKEINEYKIEKLVKELKTVWVKDSKTISVEENDKREKFLKSIIETGKSEPLISEIEK